jgi:uncharacterized protein YggU (UPF0235/DUF167 family)
MRKFEIKDAVGGAAFTVRVVTRAARAEIADVQDDGALKIRLTSSPSDKGAVNKELIQFLAKRLDVPPETIEIVAGANTREKLISVDGVDPMTVEGHLRLDLEG